MITYEDIEGFYYLGKEIEWYEEHIKKLLSCKYLSSIDEERLQRYYSGLSRSKAKRAETQAFFDNIFGTSFLHNLPLNFFSVPQLPTISI